MISTFPKKENKDLFEAFASPAPEGVLRFWWLGQAGFCFKYMNQLLLIDPYLSDSLAEKYKDRELKHKRMAPVPVRPEAIRDCSWYLCTHGHTDHMDAWTIKGVLACSSPRFLIPAAEVMRGLERGIPAENLLTINAGEQVELAPGLAVKAIPAAHEQLEVDAQGNHRFLGYILTFPGFTLFHSGDCVPYPGLSDYLAAQPIDLAFLPINGRDEFRLSHGIAGNFFVQEAIDLCQAAGIPGLVCHHFEMFDFNTIPRSSAQEALSRQAGPLDWLLPELGVAYTITN